MATILVAERDGTSRAGLARILGSAGHRVHAVGTGTEMLRTAAAEPVDLLVLDTELPDLDGVTALRMFRCVSQAPALTLAARPDPAASVRLRESGAGDCVVRPVAADELQTMVATLLDLAGRRLRSRGVLCAGDLSIDLSEQCARRGNRALNLSRIEFGLLAYLAARLGVVVRRDELIRAVWGRAPQDDRDSTIDVHVSGLRRKLGETASEARYVRTVRGVGYKFVVPSDPRRPQGRPGEGGVADRAR